MKELNNKRIIILSHILTTVPAEDLKSFLLENGTKEVLFIGHPLMYVKDRPGSYFQLYKGNELVKSRKLKNRKSPAILQYIRDTMLTIYWVIVIRKKWDVLIALNNLNVMAGLFLRKIGLVKKVVYYTIDYTPERFPNKYLNKFYHYLDKTAVKYADVTWNLTERMIEGREKRNGMDRKIYNKQVIVPIGIWFDRIKQKKFAAIEPHTLVYAGGLSPHQGIQIVIDAIPDIVKKIPDFKFNIVGIGAYESTLKKQVQDLKVSNYVNFLGYFENHEDVESVLVKGGVAAALYSKELSKWSYYADSSKIKTYLACGLPVITTSLTHIAPEIEKRECGVVIDYDKKAVAEAVLSIMQNKTKQELYRDNAIVYAKEFDWYSVFTRALKNIL